VTPPTAASFEGQRDAAAATQALRTLRRVTLGRSLRGNLQWLQRAVGWGSVVYLIAWSVVLAIAALQSLAPLPPAAEALALRFAGPALSALLALLLVRAALARVTPLWLDRRDLAHLVASPAAPLSLLAWPLWRTLLPTLAAAFAAGAVVALVAPRLLPLDLSVTASALVAIPAAALLALTLRWRSALARGRDPVAWTSAAVATLLATLALGEAALGWSPLAAWAVFPLGAALVPAASVIAWSAALTLTLLAVAVTGRAAALAAQRVPLVVVRQSEVLGALRAIATLRALAALQALPPDPGARFAAARARAALHDRPSARGPRLRPPLPRVGGTTLSYVWLALVRAGRASPWTLAALPLVAAGSALVTYGSGPFGGAALAPSLSFAWLAAQLHPGHLGWPGFAVDARGRTLALALMTIVLALGATVASEAVALWARWPAANEGWLLLPLALASAALVDLIGARAADPRALDVWLSAGLLCAIPAALLGWFDVSAGVAAPIAGGIWFMVAWLRLLAVPPLKS